MPLTIRPARLSDSQIIMEFNWLLAQETEGKSLDKAVLLKGVQACLADANKGAYFLAEDGDTIVGQIGTTAEYSDWRNGWFWWIQSVYVRKEMRRQGVFRALYNHVHQTAKADPNV